MFLRTSDTWAERIFCVQCWTRSLGLLPATSTSLSRKSRGDCVPGIGRVNSRRRGVNCTGCWNPFREEFGMTSKINFSGAHPTFHLSTKPFGWDVFRRIPTDSQWAFFQKHARRIRTLQGNPRQFYNTALITHPCFRFQEAEGVGKRL